MNEKRSTKLSRASHENSIKKRTEIKNAIDDMLTKGEKITKANIVRRCNVSRGLLNSPELDSYIKAAQRMQDENSLHMPNQENNLYRKLMSSYIFQYSLLEEQEALLNEVLKDAKSAKGLSKIQKSYILNLLAFRLANETDKNEILYQIKNFAFEEDIPDWKIHLIDILKENNENSIALETLQSIK